MGDVSHEGQAQQRSAPKSSRFLSHSSSVDFSESDNEVPLTKKKGKKHEECVPEKGVKNELQIEFLSELLNEVRRLSERLVAFENVDTK